MSVVCEACGKSNRANAMFCSGCTRRLPGFVASGPSALTSHPAPLARQAPEHDAVPTARDPLEFRPPSHRPRAGRAGASDLPLLPAEAPMFWLRLGAVALVVLIGFTSWYFYVTRKVDLAEQPIELPAAAAPDSSVTTVAPTVQSPAREAVTAAPPVNSPASPRPASANRSTPATKVAEKTPDKPAARPAPALQDKVAERERPSSRPRPKAEAPRATRPPRNAREEESGDPTAAVVARSLALARAQGDSAPADAGPGAGPGPAMSAGPGPRRAEDNAVRAPPRVPSLPANDLGPPIAPGPGPLYDFSTPGARR
jgi:hypothetical protein